MSNFWTQAHLSYKGLFTWLNGWAYVGTVFVWPATLVIMFTLLGRFAGDPEEGRRYLIGMTAYSIPNILMGGIPQAFYYERRWRTLSFLFLSTGSRLMVYWSRAAFHARTRSSASAPHCSWRGSSWTWTFPTPTGLPLRWLRGS